MTDKTLRLEADALELKALLEELETKIAALPVDTDLEMEMVGEAFARAEKLAEALADLQDGKAKAEEAAA